MIRRIIPSIVGAVLLVGFPAMEAQAHKLVLRVLVDASGSFDSAMADSAIGITFFVRGTICEDPEPGASCDSIGTFLCWGWQSDPSDVDDRPQVSVVSQEFNIFDRGKCPSSNKWDRYVVRLSECLAHHFHVTRRAVDSANGVSRWSFV